MKDVLIQALLGVCENGARAGGQVLLDMRGQFDVREKAPADLVTDADLAAQDVIRSVLMSECPDFHFLGEEDTLSEPKPVGPREYRWVVDPLDGTTNYAHGLDNFAVSVALQQGNQFILGVIYDPVRKECFRTVKGLGSFLNENPINVSQVDKLSSALVAASFPAKVERNSVEVKRFLEALDGSQAVRRLGSAALNLCYVACGRLDAYFASSLKTWDVAAGLLLIAEAGGTISNFQGGAINLNKPEIVVAATDSLHSELLGLFDAAL